MDEAICWGTYDVSLRDLEALPTISEGQADDLKIESDTERVWLSRCTVEDGEPWNNKVTVERLIAGRWIEVEWWVAVGDDEETGTFRVEIETGNAAMLSPDDVAVALINLAERMSGHATFGELSIPASIRDANGNTVGGWEFEED